MIIGPVNTFPYILSPGSATAMGHELKPDTFRRSAPKIGRNKPCPCGSGKKYKKCCIEKGDGIV